MEKAMNFSDRMRELLDQGVAASKDFAVKAGAKAQDLGERGVLMLEVKQLESQAQKAIARLGNEAYAVFTDKGGDTLSANDPAVKALLSELALIKEAVEKKETELQSRRNR
jgi:hypothetical protein